jgi:hypothetical protein
MKNEEFQRREAMLIEKWKAKTNIQHRRFLYWERAVPGGRRSDARAAKRVNDE